MYEVVRQGANHGIYATEVIPAATVIEESPVCVMSAADWSAIQGFTFYPASWYWDQDEDYFAVGAPCYCRFAEAVNATCRIHLDRQNKLAQLIANVEIPIGDELTLYWVNIAFEDR